jgi:ribonuclease HI
MTTGNQLSFINSDQQEYTKGLTLYVDGAARNNPGPAGVGIVLKNKNLIIDQQGFFLGDKTNNQAEYLALIIGLLIVRHHRVDETLTIYGDSELLIKQMTGHYRVKNPTLQHLFNVAYLISKELAPSYHYISRQYNKDADRLANHGIDTRNSLPEPLKRELHEYRIML